MKNFIKSIKSASFAFAREEEGAQVIEYALIIAVISIALVSALAALTGSGGSFQTFIDKVSTCLNTGSCTSAG